MARHFVLPRAASYQQLDSRAESLSDTEVEFRRGSPSQLEIERAKKHEENISSTSRAFRAMKIKDEMKIDLLEESQSPTSSIRSRNKIFPIDELTEKDSLLSIESCDILIAKLEELEKFKSSIQENRRKPRPMSRKPAKPRASPFGDVEVKTLHVSRYRSPSSSTVEDTEFEESFPKRVMKKDRSTSYDSLLYIDESSQRMKLRNRQIPDTDERRRAYDQYSSSSSLISNKKSKCCGGSNLLKSIFCRKKKA